MRKSVRAIIIEDNKLLTIKRQKGNNLPYYVLPGGGIEKYDENLEEAIKRECTEELGVTVNLTSELKNINHTFNDEEKIENLFYCEIASGEVGTGTGEEFNERQSFENQYSIAWLPLTRLEEFDLLPKELIYFITQ